MTTDFADIVIANLLLTYLPQPINLGYGDMSKTSAVWSHIVEGLSPKVVGASKTCTAKLFRASPKAGRWLFKVTSDSGNLYVVGVQAEPFKGSRKLLKSDLKVSCTCDFWRWQGPDHWAKRDGYLLSKPKSDGSAPSIKDPIGSNRVCKHVLAASRVFLNYSLSKE